MGAPQLYLASVCIKETDNDLKRAVGISQAHL